MTIEHSIILKSNASANNFINSTASFTNVFPDPIDLRISQWRRWYISIESLCFHNTFTNIPADFKYCTPHFLAAENGDMVEDNDVSLDMGMFWHNSIADNFYTTTEELVESMSEMFTGLKRPKIKFELTPANILRISGDFVDLFVHSRIAEFFSINHLATNGIWRIQERPYVLIRLGRHQELQGREAIELRTNAPKYINVTMPKPYIDVYGSKNHKQSLATFPYIPQPFGSSFYAEVSRAKDVCLSSTNLNSITINLLDENDMQLELARGQPTFLKMRLSCKDKNSFIFHASSNSGECTGINSNFTIALDPPLILKPENWEVALVSVQFPSHFEYWSVDDAYSFTNPFSIFTPENVYQFNFTQGEMKTIEHMIATLNHYINVNGLTDLIHISLKNRHFRIEFKDGTDEIKIRINMKLAVLLGLSYMREDLEFIEINGVSNTIHISLQAVDFNRLAPTSLMVKTNLIEPTIVGDRLSRVLKMIPVLSKNAGDVILYEAVRLTYCKVSHLHLTNITFQLEQLEETKVHFIDDTTEVLYTLQFQMRNQ
jgi:hypothetical protein